MQRFPFRISADTGLQGLNFARVLHSAGFIAQPAGMSATPAMHHVNNPTMRSLTGSGGNDVQFSSSAAGFAQDL
ncbi:MAG TPA: hypothetical protein VGF77_09680 [Allosphingosinicella sp.]|jgi:hypothetical protein